ncbi:uncharacterized protein, partial [Temnothorax nylanderi]|uniref:uncharacterized protein n=1 Tax=Temnothorax nylanderi TaxID=102681 RepID=UPI003A87640E
FKWPHEAIFLLIEEYNLRQNDFHSGKMSQKKVWSLIAAELVKHSYNVTGPQCLSKFSGLKRTYKAVKDHNSKSGNGTKKWPYFSHMDNLLGSKPFMLPVSTVSSTGKRSRSPSECSTSSDSCFEIEQKSPRKKVRQLHNVEKLIEDIKSDRKIAEEAMERRHQENIDLRKRLLDSLETMVDILRKK